MSASHVEWTDPKVPKKKRHKRPRNARALDENLALLPDLEPAVWCPYENGHWAAISAFGKNSSRPSGLSTYCRACRKKAEKKYRKKAGKKDVVGEMRRLRKRIEKAVARVIAALDREATVKTVGAPIAVAELPAAAPLPSNRTN